MCSAFSQISILWCRYWFYDCLDLQQKLKSFLHSSQETNGMRSFLEFMALSCSSEVKFPWFLAFFVSCFFGYIHFHAGSCCRPQRYRLVLDQITIWKKAHNNSRPPDTTELRWIAVVPFLYCVANNIVVFFRIDKSLDVCIFDRFKVNCETIPLRCFAILKLRMSRHRKSSAGP